MDTIHILMLIYAARSMCMLLYTYTWVLFKMNNIYNALFILSLLKTKRAIQKYICCYLYYIHVYKYVYHILDAADASDVYDTIDVSDPAMLGGRVTFTIMLKKTCSQSKWQYRLGNANQMFIEDTTITIVNKPGKVDNTYKLTLMNATSTYHKTNISFYCDSQVPVDTVTLNLIGK